MLAWYRVRGVCCLTIRVAALPGFNAIEKVSVNISVTCGEVPAIDMI